MTKMQPQVSVLMSVYNSERWLAEAIESVLNQTFADFEFLIVNDGSTDSSGEIINRYAKQDSRIRVFDKSNTGLSDSLNYGIKRASGEFIARADADDFNFTERIARQYRFMIENPQIDVLGAGAWLKDKEDQRVKCVLLKKTHEELSNLPLLKTHFFHSSVMIRRDFFKKVGLYDCKYKRAQDKELWLRGLEYDVKYENLQIPLIEYRTDGYKRSWVSIRARTNSLFMMQKKYRFKFGYFYILISFVFSVLIKFNLRNPLAR